MGAILIPFQHPLFGVVNVADQKIQSIDEKPVHSFFVNAGIYVLEPAVLDYIESGEFTDMPSVVEAVIADGHTTSAFPLREAWLDVAEGYQFTVDSAYAATHKLLAGGIPAGTLTPSLAFGPDYVMAFEKSRFAWDC